MTQPMVSRRRCLQAASETALAVGAFTGGTLFGLSAGTAAPTTPALAAKGADAELIALGELYLKLMDQICAGYDAVEKGDDAAMVRAEARSEELCIQQGEIEERVKGMTAHTIEGATTLLRLGLMMGGDCLAVEPLTDRYVYGDHDVRPREPDCNPVLFEALVALERLTGIPDTYPNGKIS